jgi:VWFA-related protein
MRIKSIIPVALVFTAFGWAHTICALGRSGQDTPASTAHASPQTVNLPVVVRDKHGIPAANLSTGDFTVTDNGRPQTIQALTQASGVPLQMGLLVQTDGSMARALESERKAAEKFIELVLPASPSATSDSQAFLIHFDREVELLDDFTGARDRLINDIDRLGPTHAAENTQGPETTDTEGGRANSRNRGPQLYDAIYLAADDLMKSKKGRKALIVFGNGLDGGSKESLNEAIDAAERAGVSVYTVYFRGDEQRSDNGYSGRRRDGMGGGWPGRYPGGGYPGGGYPGGGYPGGGYPGGGRGTSRLPEADGRRIMEEIATRTGGVYFEAKKSADLMEIYSRAGQDVLSQYLVSYSPDPSSDDADFHKVVIKAVKGDLVVNAPEGYYSSKDDTK